MQHRTSVRAIFHCSLERAFKSPMLCDVTKVHSGWLMMPKVTHCEGDATWGRTNGSRRVFIQGNFFYKGGEAALDTVLERTENRYWKIEISNLRYFLFGITRLQGEWATKEIEKERIEVTYSYTLFSNEWALYPLHWFIVKVIWRRYMRHVMENVRVLAYSSATYTHD